VSVTQAFKVFGMKPEDLERVLNRAEHIGDTQLAQAVYHEALERGIFAIANRYRGTNSDARRRWERYVEARRRVESDESLLSSALKTQAPERPQELGGVPSW
jgi:hypothetical protein